MVALDYRGPTIPAEDVHKPDAFFVVRERAGVRFYWLVDVKRRTVTIYERREERLVATETLRPGDTLRCPLFPELSVAVGWLFSPT
jgi:Uma2 family endonuclease